MGCRGPAFRQEFSFLSCDRGSLHPTVCIYKPFAVSKEFTLLSCALKRVLNTRGLEMKKTVLSQVP